MAWLSTTCTLDILHEQSAIDPGWGGGDIYVGLRPGRCWPNQMYFRMTLYLAPSSELYLPSFNGGFSSLMRPGWDPGAHTYMIVSAYE